MYSKKLPIANFTEIRQGESLSYVRTDGQDEAKWHFSRLYERA